MSRLDYDDIKHIEELEIGSNQGTQVIAQLNAYLELGWKLLDIHERGFRSMGESSYKTVYILGSKESDPRIPAPHKEVENGGY